MSLALGLLLSAGFEPKWIGEHLTFKEIMLAGRLIGEAQGVLKPNEAPLTRPKNMDESLEQLKKLGVLEEK